MGVESYLMKAMLNRSTYRLWKSRWLVLWGLLVLSLIACSGESRTLVKVDEVVIDEIDLGFFETKLPDHLNSPYRGEERVRDLLQSMVGRELMVMESVKRGYPELPEVQRRFSEIQSRWLIGQLMATEAGDRLQVSEEEARSFFAKYDLGRFVLPAQIIVENEDQALAVIQKLEAGEKFAAIARDESIAENAAMGGDLRKFLGYGDLPHDMRDALWKLEVGEFTRQPVRLRRGYGVYRILDVSRKPFAEMAPRIVKFLGKKKVAQERQRLIEKWSQRLEVRYHRAGIDALLALAGEFGELAEDVEGQALVTYDGGIVPVGEGVRTLTRKGRLMPGVADSSQVVMALQRGVVGDSILVQAARRTGLSESEEFVKFREKRRRELLAKELWRHEARYKVEVGDDEVRQVYEDSTHKFVESGGVDVVEILVEEREEAVNLRERISAGEDMGWLAIQFSIREDARQARGRLHVHAIDRDLAPLYDRAQSAVPEELVGPLEIGGNYSIFKLIGKEGARTKPFEQVAPAIRLGIRKRRETELFEAFMENLHSHYREQVVWFDDNIKAVAKSRDSL